jgi:TonB family protein
MLGRLLTVSIVIGIAACREGRGERGIRVGDRPDEMPVMVNRDLPFRYPVALYARKVQGNVMLRLFVDRDGRILPESTRVEESSGHSSLDSAAVKGSQELYFIPAKLHGEPLAVSVLFPVYFRHPEAAPLPGDTVIGRREEGAGRTLEGGPSQTPPSSLLPPPSNRP